VAASRTQSWLARKHVRARARVSCSIPIDDAAVASTFLESVLLSACPELRASWDAARHDAAASSRPEPDDATLLDAVRRHVLTLLLAGRVAQFARFARALERLLAEADPVLHELLLDGLIRPLARDVRIARVPAAHVAPHLGRRTALAWPGPW
jgi:hypothetical protein